MLARARSRDLYTSAVARLEKGYTEGLQPSVTEHFLNLIVSPNAARSKATTVVAVRLRGFAPPVQLNDWADLSEEGVEATIRRGCGSGGEE